LTKLSRLPAWESLTHALNTLISSLITLQSERANLLFSQTEASPRVRELTRKIQDASSSILELIRNLSNSAQLKINDLESRINSISIANSVDCLPPNRTLVRIQNEEGTSMNPSSTFCNSAGLKRRLRWPRVLRRTKLWNTPNQTVQVQLKVKKPGFI
jgi:hypothetical protein